MSIDKINSSEWDGWYISFEGVILLKSGGYVKQQQRIKVNRKRDGFYLKITAMGGGFAGLYGLFEISKHLYPHLCPFLVAFLHKIYSIFCFC